MLYQIRSALHIGRSHINYGKNCQDALDIRHGQDYAIGIVCDGCSEGKHSEVGSNLASRFLSIEAEKLVSSGIAASIVPGILYHSLLKFLRLILDSYSLTEVEKVEFIKDHLLFTVMGAIITPHKAVIFTQGDGLVIVNDDQKIIDQDNSPYYFSYHLLDPRYLSDKRSALPSTFQIDAIEAKVFQRCAIGSDAWAQELNLLSAIWGYESAAGLQRRINVWAREKHFEDDVSLITIEKGEV